MADNFSLPYTFEGMNNNSALGSLPGSGNDYSNFGQSSTFLPQLTTPLGQNSVGNNTGMPLGYNMTGAPGLADAGGGFNLGNIFGGNAAGYMQGAGELAQGFGSIMNYFQGKNQIKEGKRQFGINQEFAERQYADSKARYDQEYGMKQRARARFGIT